jgi:phage shock protein A
MLFLDVRAAGPRDQETPSTNKERGTSLALGLNFVSRLTQLLQRRREQNRVAQVRHRDKRNRFLHEVLRKIEALDKELQQTRSQRDHFRRMFEDLEHQVMQLQSQSSSRFPSCSPRQI